MNQSNYFRDAWSSRNYRQASLGKWCLNAQFGAVAIATTLCILPFASSRGEEFFFNASFEAPEYAIGTLDGQSGWKVDQGRAEIQLGEGRMGSAGLVLLPEEPFSQARLQLATDIGFNQTLFLDVYVRPVASDAAEKEEMIDINSARIGVFNDSSADGASIWVFDGDVNGGGKWVRTSEIVAIDKESGRAAQWHRLTVRQDLEGHSWDLWVDGKWAAAGMGLQEPHARQKESTYIFMGDTVGRVSVDDLWIGVVPPPQAELLPPGEVSYDATKAVEQRDERARLSADGNKDTDGDSLSDRNELLLGLDPLVVNDKNQYLPSPTTEVFTRIQIPLVKRGIVLDDPFPHRAEELPIEEGN